MNQPRQPKSRPKHSAWLNQRVKKYIKKKFLKALTPYNSTSYILNDQSQVIHENSISGTMKFKLDGNFKIRDTLCCQHACQASITIPSKETIY